MAIRQRYYSNIQSRSGDVYKLSLWDLEHSTSIATQNVTWGWNSSSDNNAKELSILYDSVEITWDGDNDKVHQPIIGSALKFTILATDDIHMGVIKALRFGTEFKVGIKLERFNYTSDAYEPYWYGVVLPEGVSYAYAELPTEIQITATDGLSTLRDKPYINTDDTLYAQTTNSIHAPARAQIGNCFKHLPHLALWGEQDPFFYECCDLFHESHATLDGSNAITSIESIVDQVGCNQNIWYEKRDVDPPFFRDTKTRDVGVSSYAVIENWMVTLGLRMCHVNGAFLAVSPFSNQSNVNSRLYKSDKRTLVDPTYQFSTPVLQDSNTTLLPDVLDFSAEEVLVGSSQTFMHPLRGMYYVHKQGGAARLFPEVKWVAVEGDFPQTDQTANLLGQIYDVSENYNVSFPLQNDDCVVPTNRPLRLAGIFQHFFRPEDTSSSTQTPAIGAQFEVKMKVKVGQYFLKQSVGLVSSGDLSNDSNFGKINKSGSDINTWRPLVITDDVAWTTNSADRFSFPAFLTGGVLTPNVDPLQYEVGDGTIIEYMPGFGCRRHPDKPNEQKYDSTSRGLWLQAYEIDLDFALPDLPTSTLNETGIEITVEVKMYLNTTATTTVGSEVFPTNPLRPDGARIINFNVYVGDGSDEDDAFYYEQFDEQNGREMGLGGETLVASRVVEDYGEIGAITANTFYTHKWHSENDFTFDSGRRNLSVLAEEHIRIRGKSKDAFNLRFLVSTAELPWTHPLQTIQWTHESVNTYLRCFNMTHAISENVVTVEGFKIGREAGGTTGVHDANKKNNGTNSVGGGGISGTSPVFVPRGSTVGSGGGGIGVDDATKLATITLDGNQVSNFNAKADSIAAVSITTSSSRNFVTNSQLTDIQAIAANTAKRSFPVAKENEVTANTSKDGITAQQAANINTNLAKVTFPGFGTAAGKAMEGDTTTITTTQANNINNNLLKISYPPADANKVANLTVTAATDLDTMRGNVTANNAKTGITSGQAAAIVANTTVTDHFTLDVSNNITAIALQSNAIAAAAITQSSGLQFISSSELAAITTNTSNVSTLQSEVQAIEDVIQSVTSGGGKGVYFNSTKVTTNAHVTVGDKAASLFAGSNTGVAVTETSPGTVALHVQAGSSGSEVQVTAMTIVGSGTLQNAAVTFSQPVTFSSSVAGLTSSTITEGSKLFYTNARADARIALANVSDLSDVTDAGSGSIITSAERTKLNGIAAGAQVNVDTSLSNADQTIGGTRLINLGASGELQVKANSLNGLTPFSIESNGNDPATIRVNGDFRMDSGALSGGILKLEESPNVGSHFVALQAPTSITADVTYKLPAADGSSGQFIQTDGSGNLSFASASGGGSSDGWHGHTTKIKVMPSDFVGNDVGRTTTQVRIEDDTSNTLGAAVSLATGSCFAFVPIPTGYKATGLIVRASSTVTNGVTSSHYDYTTGGVSESQTFNTNTTHNFSTSTQLVSSDEDVLVIKVSPGSGAVIIYGATVNIVSQ